MYTYIAQSHGEHNIQCKCICTASTYTAPTWVPMGAFFRFRVPIFFPRSPWKGTLGKEVQIHNSQCWVLNKAEAMAHNTPSLAPRHLLSSSQYFSKQISYFTELACFGQFFKYMLFGSPFLLPRVPISLKNWVPVKNLGPNSGWACFPNVYRLCPWKSADGWLIKCWLQNLNNWS